MELEISVKFMDKDGSEAIKPVVIDTSMQHCQVMNSKKHIIIAKSSFFAYNMLKNRKQRLPCKIRRY